jgi:heptosyltransferase-2
VRRRALIVAPSWVGDTIIAMPMVSLLRERDPDLELDLLAPPWTLALGARMPGIARTIESPFRHGELRLRARHALARELARQDYERCWILPNSLKSALVPWLAGIPVRTGYVGEWRHWLVNDLRRFDAAELPQLAQRFAALALPPGASLPATLPAPRLQVDESARSRTLLRLGLAEAGGSRPVAVLCPGAEYGPAKRWPPSHFAELADQLAESGYAVWLLGSSKDAETAREIVSLASRPPVDLCGRTSLAEAIDLMSVARAVISNDSGLMHVAAALDRPLVALYGSSSPDYTPPMSTRASVLRVGVSCSPCFRRECPLGHFDCMRRLTPAQVMAAIDGRPPDPAP